MCVCVCIISWWCIHTTAVKLNQFWHGLKFIYGLERVLALAFVNPRSAHIQSLQFTTTAALWLLHPLLFAVLFSTEKLSPNDWYSFFYSFVHSMIKRFFCTINCVFFSRAPPTCQFVLFNVCVLNLISIAWYCFCEMSLLLVCRASASKCNDCNSIIFSKLVGKLNW